jgi:hypothetical protein
MSNNFTFRTAGGRITCIQCNARSKRTGILCRAPAAKGKTKCRFHGGAATGPKTPEGRKRCAEVRLVHGQETTRMRKERSLASARLAMLEMVGHALGFMNGGRTRGRKPALMEEVEEELHQTQR